MAVTDVDQAVAKPHSRFNPLQALGVLLAVIVVVAGYVAICAALKLQEFYGGFLFVLCWAALEHTKIDKLPRVVLGAILGLALGFLNHTLMSGPLGATGGLVFAAVTLPIIYCQIMGWFPIFINMTAMVFLTVTTIPYIQAQGDFHQLAEALAIGVLYFGGILALVARVTERAARKV